MKIALFQMRSGIDPAQNAAALVDAVHNAQKNGAIMLFTPEMSGLLDRDRARASAHILPEHAHPVLTAVQAAARKAGLWVHLGSLALQGQDRCVNRGFLITPEGEISARYDKLHLFDVDLPTGESWRESAAYEPGKDSVIAPTPIGPLGLSICYDLRFPALYQALSAAGAEVLAVPAAFTVPTGQAHWHLLLRARAIENACWVVAAAQSRLGGLTLLMNNAGVGGGGLWTEVVEVGEGLGGVVEPQAAAGRHRRGGRGGAGQGRARQRQQGTPGGAQQPSLPQGLNAILHRCRHPEVAEP